MKTGVIVKDLVAVRNRCGQHVPVLVLVKTTQLPDTDEQYYKEEVTKEWINAKGW
jgi:hypothetical protein